MVDVTLNKTPMSSDAAAAAIAEAATRKLGVTPPLLKGDTAAERQDSETGLVAGARLKQYVERIERLQEEVKALGADIRDIFTEAKSAGFDVKTMRQVLKLRKMADQERRELNELLDLYMAAIGMD